ncbi:MAG: 1-deoxy-D-xylulose-5-phosphate reductoisomerase [Candidatus Gracilibacteria bacterium]|nr:1-deoxy-D-xylulose-5-phosphate reductoisomerase [Candidatus Gracilibacteria bacterium]
MAQKIVILGSTGSVGQQVLQVIKDDARFEVLGLSGFRNEKLLEKQLKEFKVPYFFNAQKFNLTGATFTELTKLASLKKADLVVNAIVGQAGLEPTLAALRAGKKVLLANKEVMVMAGEQLMKLARQNKTEIIPLDSEINAIWQCLQGEEKNNISKVILTCSGGPFYTWKTKDLQKVTAKQATQHPNWKMGKKISVDCATLMNKGFEVIETAYFFGLRPEQIEVLVHPQSIVHALVEFTDGNTKAIMYKPDMQTAIRAALYSPHRTQIRFCSISDILVNKVLSFSRPDTKKFPCLKFAFQALGKGGKFPSKLSLANEEAVRKFLSGELRFTDISKLLSKLF